MTLQQLYYFQAIAQAQHYRLAAEKLNVAQPTLSRSISNLEEELGVYLFEKSGRNVVLTKVGKVFLDYVDTIIRDVEIAQEKMHQLVSSSAGHIDVGYVSTLAQSYIPKLVRGFLNHDGNQEITFSLNHGFTSNLVTDLKTNKLDVVFGSYLDNQPDLVFTPILNQELFAIVPSSHPLASEKAVDLKIFEEYPVIAYDEFSGLGRNTRKIFESSDVHPNITCEASDEYAIAALVREDFGISLVADCAAIKQADGIRILPIKNSNFCHTVYMIHNRNRYQVPAVKKFLKFASSFVE
ncbi:MAG: LysR family transcriptional regulator [Hespellia sp.]|nr:LysR family transcriptional regulator [Hespellia sp.]